MPYFNAHTHHLPTDSNEIALINVSDFGQNAEGSFCTIGLHPWFLNAEIAAKQVELIEQNASKPEVRAIGECGLDKLCDVDLGLQIAVFEQMIRISEIKEKPLLIHCVKAIDEIVAIKDRIKPRQKWVLHGFRGNPIQANQLIELDFLFSIGVKYNVETIKLLPLHRFFIETDDHKISVENVYRSIAIDRGIDLQELSNTIRRNAVNVFGIE